MRRVGGYVLLGAAFLVWLTAIMMSPHGQSSASHNIDHVKASVAIFARNASLGTLVLLMLSAAALFWRRRPTRSARDLASIAAIALLAATSFYQLVWIETDVLHIEEVQAAPSAVDGT